MKRKIINYLYPIILAAMIFLLLFAAGCQKSNDKPPEMEGPEPEAHSGVFVSQNAVFTFDGSDTVFVDFDDDYLKVLDNPPNKTFYTYAFTWYEFGQYRYDAATNLKLYHEESKTRLDFIIGGTTTADKITISYTLADNEKLEFVKKE